MPAEVNWAERPDRELVGQALHAGSAAVREAAFSAIFARYHRVILAYCGGMLQDPHAAADAAAQTFTEAFTSLASLQEPRKLRGWLLGIARNRCRAEWERARRQGPMPESWDGGEDPFISHDRASKARQAQVDRLLDTVAETFTAKQRQVYQLAVGQGLAGTRLAAALAVTPAQASRQAHEIIIMAYEGFGALVLARDGRRYCPVLAGILDQYAWNGENFTRTLRLRISRHLNTCDTCRTRRERLVAPLAPAVIPILVFPVVQRRVEADIRRKAQGGVGAGTGNGNGTGAGAATGTGTGTDVKANASSKKRGKTGGGILVAAAIATALRLAASHAHSAAPVLSIWIANGAEISVEIGPAGGECLPSIYDDPCHIPLSSGATMTLTTNPFGGDPGNFRWLGCPSGTDATQPCVLTTRQSISVCLVHQSSSWTLRDCYSWAAGQHQGSTSVGS